MSGMQGCRSITSPDFEKNKFEGTHSGYPETSNISCNPEEIMVFQTDDSSAWI